MSDRKRTKDDDAKGTPKPERTEEFYDEIKRKFAEERDLRLALRPDGMSNYFSDFDGELARFDSDPHCPEVTPREPIAIAGAEHPVRQRSAGKRDCPCYCPHTKCPRRRSTHSAEIVARKNTNNSGEFQNSVRSIVRVCRSRRGS